MPVNSGPVPARPASFRQTADTPLDLAIARYAAQGPDMPRGRWLTPHLRALESESIEIMREVVAQAEKPVLLYSMGKDSTVMMHLARKAFYPAKPFSVPAYREHLGLCGHDPLPRSACSGFGDRAADLCE